MNDFPGGAVDQRELPTQRGMDLASLAARYRTNSLTPLRLVHEILEQIDARGQDLVWIHRLSREQLLAYARRLEGVDPADKPLYGVPFAIKDNIDLAGHPTTAGCPDFTYVAETRRRSFNG